MDFIGLQEKIREQWGDEPAAKTCIDLITAIGRLPNQQRKMLTYTSFANLLEKKYIDSDLLTAVNILTSSNLHLFDAKALFVDYDESEYELSAEELGDAIRNDELVHPETGDLIKEFRSRLMPFFVVSSKFSSVE